ncbi:MAG: acetylornithine deacetylase [Pseudorhodoplanes sp.]|uniref:acetylornithine deacetylase n=1 Tax=Pseudorhodoplanes sp. TaxID=1934341 RepID=UPI003D105A13
MTTPQTTLSILHSLIGFASVSSESNLDIVQWIEDYLSQHGVTSRRIPDRTGRKASILATIGPAGRAGVVLSAHTDVVPVAGQDWSSPPFTATQNGDRVIGRGTTDMKGFIASVLAHVPLFVASAAAAPIHIALSYDEEVGCLGAPDLVAEVAKADVKPALCIVGEPTGHAVGYAHKGKVARRVIVTGRGGHSALPHRAANAVLAAARIAAGLEDLAQRMARDSARDAAFDPPYTTIHVGSLHGGTALNFVPDRATLEFEIRHTPGTDVEALLGEIGACIAGARERLKAQAPEAGILVEDLASYPALVTASTDPAIATAQRLAGGTEPARTVSFGTEAGIYSAAGIPTVVCGPGDIVRAHKADEWIGIDELARTDRMMQRLAAQLGRPAEEWIR